MPPSTGQSPAVRLAGTDRREGRVHAWELQCRRADNAAVCCALLCPESCSIKSQLPDQDKLAVF